MVNQRILVVDDEANMRRLLEIMLTQLGYDVQQAADGCEALDYLSQNDVDLVITDLQMPGKNGLELLEELRERKNTVAVIVVTAYGTVESAVQAMKYGAYDYILRPFELETLEATIKRAMQLNKIQRENTFLRQEIEKGWGEFIGNSEAMCRVYDLIRQVAPTKTSVMIQGETGTGKELVARAIHRASPRAKALFVSINCAAIPPDILESELFGHSKGAFTGASQDRMGKFELADGGTLFLDEITEMDFNMQAKLLRVLQERMFERVGSNRSISVDIRLIAATNRDPRQAIAEQKLREDLYYRLNVFTVDLPPLRARQEDILLMAEHFLQKYATEFGFRYQGIEREAEEWLMRYGWPGNVRELENMMERAIVLSGGKAIGIRHLPNFSRPADNGPAADFDGAMAQLEQAEDIALVPHVEKLEKALIDEALQRSGGNKAKAAQILQISERSFWYKLKKYRID